MRADEVGPVLWTRQVQFTFAGIAIDQHETVHVGWTDVAGEWEPKHLEALEALAFQDARWWEVDELADSGVRTIPDDLVDWLRRLPARGLAEESELLDRGAFLEQLVLGGVHAGAGEVVDVEALDDLPAPVTTGARVAVDDAFGDRRRSRRSGHPSRPIRRPGCRTASRACGRPRRWRLTRPTRSRGPR